MSYIEMINMIDEYINSGDLKDRKWIEILQTCKKLIKEKLNDKD